MPTPSKLNMNAIQPNLVRNEKMPTIQMTNETRPTMMKMVLRYDWIL